MTDRYVELHAASAFSFLEGASQPEELVERAVELEMPAMALLDRNGVYGSARFHTSSTRNDIRAHVGAEISVSSLGPRLTPPAWLPHQHIAEPARLPLLCESREGYQNLCQLITRFKMREKSKGEGAATLEDVQQYASGLVCLPPAATRVMLQRRVHDFVCQSSGNLGCAQGLHELRIEVQGNAIGRHGGDRAASLGAEAEQQRSEEGVIQQQRGPRLLDADHA
jgi:DNA polymerase III alpha subunit